MVLRRLFNKFMQLNLANLFHQNIPVRTQNATYAIFTYPQTYYNNSMSDLWFAVIHVIFNSIINMHGWSY